VLKCGPRSWRTKGAAAVVGSHASTSPLATNPSQGTS
jgi:hypothetical protein